jgi:hypothetical protein
MSKYLWDIICDYAVSGKATTMTFSPARAVSSSVKTAWADLIQLLGHLRFKRGRPTDRAHPASVQ